MQLCNFVMWLSTVLFLPISSCRLFGDSTFQPQQTESSQPLFNSKAATLADTVKTSFLIGDLSHHPLCSDAHAVVVANQEETFGHKPGTQTRISIQALGDRPEQVAFVITGIKQNEPTSGLYPGDHCPDAQVDGLGSLSLRLENSQMTADENRHSGHQGRTYYISFAAKLGDAACEGVVSVCIPAIGSDSCAAFQQDVLYDSTVCPGLG